MQCRNEGITLLRRCFFNLDNYEHFKVLIHGIPELRIHFNVTCRRQVFLGRLSRLLCVPAEPYTRLPRNLDDAELDMTPFPYDTDPPATRDAAPADDKDRALEATLDDIRKYLRICARHATSGGETGSHHQVVLNEWIQLARVIDRLLFAIFLTITFLTLCIAF